MRSYKEYKKGGSGKQKWIAAKTKQLINEGKSQDEALLQATSMYTNNFQTGTSNTGYPGLNMQEASFDPTLPNYGQMNIGSSNYLASQPLIPTTEPSLDLNPSQINNQITQTTPEWFTSNTGTTKEEIANNRPQLQSVDTGLSATTPDYMQMTNPEQELQNNANVVTEELQQTQSQKQLSDTINPQDNKVQFFNSYAGVDIPTAASYLGQSIEEGDTLGTVASAAKLGTGLARNIFGAMGRQRREDQVMQEYREDQRDYVTQANRATYMEEGGEMTIPEALTGEFRGEQEYANVNSEVEKGEYTKDPQNGDIREVKGDTHENGG